MTEVLDEVWRIQAGFCRRMGSPLNAALLDRAAPEILANGPTASLLAPWFGKSRQQVLDDALPLRWMAAFHDLALEGDAAMAAAYEARDPDALWAAVQSAQRERAGRIVRFMSHEPQTNEVRRSACLLPGFLQIARATGLPLRSFELAASAGLNVSWDRYRYALGDIAWGDPASPVVLETDWEGPPVVPTPATVVERAACDRRPVDLREPEQRRRLLAYIWADQPERLARIRAAIEVTLAQGVTVEKADAADWIAARVAPKPGAATVIYHSIFWQYVPHDGQARITQRIADVGARASAEAPVAWLRMEPPVDNLATIELRLTTWPGGDERLLANVHPHGAWVRWAS